MFAVHLLWPTGVTREVKIQIDCKLTYASSAFSLNHCNFLRVLSFKSYNLLEYLKYDAIIARVRIFCKIYALWHIFVVIKAFAGKGRIIIMHTSACLFHSKIYFFENIDIKFVYKNSNPCV